MAIVRKLLLGLGAVVVAFVVVGLLLPGHVHVARSAEIAAPPAAVVAHLDGFATFNQWSPWAALDPATRYSFAGPARGVGAHMEWHSDDPSVGAGRQDVVAVDGERQVRWRVEFVGQGAGEMTFDLEPAGAGTRLTWHFDMDMGLNPIGRWFGLMMDGAIGGDFERGLARLKALAERPAAPLSS